MVHIGLLADKVYVRHTKQGPQHIRAAFTYYIKNNCSHLYNVSTLAARPRLHYSIFSNIPIFLSQFFVTLATSNSTSTCVVWSR